VKAKIRTAQKIVSDTAGASLVEYVFILMLIALVAFGALQVLGVNVVSKLGDLLNGF